MTKEIIEKANILFININTVLEFGLVEDLHIDLNQKYLNNLSKEKNQIKYNKEFPIKIKFITSFILSNRQQLSLINQLYDISYYYVKTCNIKYKGILTIKDKVNYKIRIFNDAILTSEPKYLGRTVSNNHQSLHYRVTFSSMKNSIEYMEEREIPISFI